MADVSELVEYYKNLLVVQYHGKPKAQATIALLIDAMLANGLAFDVRDGFDIDTAIGAQLDIIGLYVGIDRFYQGQVLSGYFAFTEYNEVSIPADKRGFAVYADYDTKTGKTLKYSDVLSQDLKLPDDAFRFVLKLKIVQNNSNHSHKSIDDSLYTFFGNTLIMDSIGNMVMNYFAYGVDSGILDAVVQKKVLPKPMGVRLQYLIEQDEPLFGFATYDKTPAGITGFSTYADFDSKVGDTVVYNDLRSI